ncbi:MAG: hypothetical protein AB7S38_38650 [Vulcanimicrobiota bacterium]
MGFDERLERLEQRVERDDQHLERVIVTQREIVQKAFDQVNLALLEQQIGLKAFADNTRDSLRELIELMKGQRAENDRELEAIKARLDRLESPPAA